MNIRGVRPRARSSSPQRYRPNFRGDGGGRGGRAGRGGGNFSPRRNIQPVPPIKKIKPQVARRAMDDSGLVPRPPRLPNNDPNDENAGHWHGQGLLTNDDVRNKGLGVLNWFGARPIHAPLEIKDATASVVNNDRLSEPVITTPVAPIPIESTTNASAMDNSASRVHSDGRVQPPRSISTIEIRLDPTSFRPTASDGINVLDAVPVSAENAALSIDEQAINHLEAGETNVTNSLEEDLVASNDRRSAMGSFPTDELIKMISKLEGNLVTWSQKIGDLEKTQAELRAQEEVIKTEIRIHAEKIVSGEKSLSTLIEERLFREQEENGKRLLEERQRQEELLEQKERQRLLEERQHQKELLEQTERQRVLEERQRQKELLEQTERQRLLEERQHQKELLEQTERQRVLEERQRQKELLEQTERQRQQELLEQKERQRLEEAHLKQLNLDRQAYNEARIAHNGEASLREALDVADISHFKNEPPQITLNNALTKERLMSLPLNNETFAMLNPINKYEEDNILFPYSIQLIVRPFFDRDDLEIRLNMTTQVHREIVAAVDGYLGKGSYAKLKASLPSFKAWYDKQVDRFLTRRGQYY
ncbi:hypothetical protein EDC01DRAFT_204551 [Geopyxis carbonaria]|nr:hypothetical protein EDC01DRAFT_204551 [Geopyxis carbonaria]